MLESMHIKSLTVFDDITLEFGRLNVLHGTNGTGKTHILKLIYACISALTPRANDPVSLSGEPTKAALEKGIASELAQVFRPDKARIGRLARRIQGQTVAEVECHFDELGELRFEFGTQSSTNVRVTEVPTQWGRRLPVYIPVRELLTSYPGFVSLYESQAIPFDKTWRDTSSLLGRKIAKGPKADAVKKLLKPLEDAIGCKAVLEGDRFYVLPNGSQARIEVDLVAEGHRKLAMIGQLIANGSLDDKGFLLWDEPEANLNPELIVRLAPLLIDLAAAGLQIFIATHSLFLLRELRITELEQQAGSLTRYFGLHRPPAGDSGVQVEQGDAVEDSGEVLSLELSNEQAARYLRAIQRSR